MTNQPIKFPGNRNQPVQSQSQQIRVELTEEDYCKYPSCGSGVFLQVFRVAIAKTIVVGERQIIMQAFLHCAKCDQEINPQEVKSQRELASETENNSLKGA
jgi:hypothetical protein